MKTIFYELFPALRVEYLKVRRSKTLWLTVLAFLLATIIGGLFMFILKDPERARQLGIIGAKAQILGGTADWTSFFNLMLVLVSVGGLIIFGFIFVWIFGREYSDKTYYDMLSLPTSRVTIIVAKIITAACWSMALVLLAFVLMLGIGKVLQLPGWSSATTMHGLSLLLGTGILTVLACIAFALIASMTRGYLTAVGGIFLVLVLGQIINQIGYGQYFPWNIPMMYSGAAQALSGKTAPPLAFISYLLVMLVGISSIIATGAWWCYADQT
jgi:ABC-2 type transport system permease protein